MTSNPDWTMFLSSSRALQASSRDQGTQDHAMVAFVGNLLPIVSHKASYQRLLQQRGGQAQLLIDNLQLALQAHRWVDAQKETVLKATLRLSKVTGLLPTSYRLPEIEVTRRVYEAPCVDIYRGAVGGRVVCLKKYRSCYLDAAGIHELMSREAVIWANHPHTGILPFLGVYQNGSGVFDSGLYLVSPFMEHGTITEFLASFPGVDRRLLLKDIADAISFLHHHHIIHADIKGANVLVSSGGRACLADLGFARLTEAAVLTWTSIQSTVCLGTVPWQAPELLQVQRSGGYVVPTAASDVYALGCLAYEIFTNKPPFWNIREGAHSATRAYQIIKAVVKYDERPQKPSNGSRAFRLHGLTEEVWSFMAETWRRDPQLRPSAAEVS
ncbi:kinase-like protein, partial [Coprinellus micaceus]